MSHALPTIVTHESAPKYMLVGDPLTLLLAGEQTANGFTLIHSVVSPGFGPPPHVHTSEEETFYVLSGEITFYTQGQPTVLTAGHVIHLPRNVPHHFKNTGTSGANVLIHVSPAGGFENYLRTVGEPLPADYVHDHPVPPTAAHLEKVRAHAPAFGIKFLP